MTPIEKLEKLLAEATAGRSGPCNEGFRVSIYFNEPEQAHDLHHALTVEVPALLAALRTQGERITKLEEALRPFALAAALCPPSTSLDDAFVWEPRNIEDRPMVTFGAIRHAQIILNAVKAANGGNYEP